MKNAFTMIELIFVIVILGILAAVAIPKLMSTRVDAQAIKEIYNLSVCIHDVGSAYNSSGNESVGSSACVKMKCFELSSGVLTDGQFTISLGGDDDGQRYCEEAQTRAAQRNLVQTFHYGETNVVY